MKKYLLLLCILLVIGSCCTKQEDCKCKPVVMNFGFDCFTEKELADFRIIKYDSSNGTLISSESIAFIRPSFGNAQYNINIGTDTKYDIEFVNKPLGISRRFSDFTYGLEDEPKECFDCKTKMRYKTCSEVSYINFLVNGKATDKSSNLRSDAPTVFTSANTKNCGPGYVK